MKNLLKKETLAESIGIVTAFILLQRIIQVGRGIAFARLLGPSEYGVFTLAFFFIPLVVTLGKLGIPACYERYVHQYEKAGMLGSFFRKNYLLTIVAGAFFTILCLFFSNQISELLYATTKYKNIVILCSVTAFFFVLYENFISSFNGLRIFKMSSLLKFSQFFIFTILGILLVFFSHKAESAILANLVSYIIVVIIFGFVINRFVLSSVSQNSKIQEKNFYGKMLKYSIWFIVTSVIFTLFKYTDRWMLNRFLGLHEVGVYSVASNITGLLFMFGMIAGNVLLPNLSKIWENKDEKKAIFLLNSAIKINTLVLLFGAVVLVFLKKQIISILYGAEYLEGLPIIAVLSIFWLFNSIFWTIKGYSGLVEKTHLPFISVSVGLILNVILNYILIPHHKMMGAAVASTISFGIILVMLFALNKKEGMRIELSTVLACLSPLILLFDSNVFLFISISIFGTFSLIMQIDFNKSKIFFLRIIGPANNILLEKPLDFILKNLS
jgi:O-antigen/teichoic acid export membrane protein